MWNWKQTVISDSAASPSAAVSPLCLKPTDCPQIMARYTVELVFPKSLSNRQLIHNHQQPKGGAACFADTGGKSYRRYTQYNQWQSFWITVQAQIHISLIPFWHVHVSRLEMSFKQVFNVLICLRIRRCRRAAALENLFLYAPLLALDCWNFLFFK